jgi:hypothetical protein
MGGSLWDRDELAVRYVLEEGKLNVVICLLIEFKSFTLSDNLEVMQKTAVQAHMTVDQWIRRVQLMERHVGLILQCSLNSIETVQTVDMPQLVHYCAAVFSHFLNPSHNAKRVIFPVSFVHGQEIRCINYLLLVLRRIEQLNEDRILQIFLDNTIVLYSIYLMAAIADSVEEDVKLSCVEYFARLCDCEEFSEHTSLYLPNASDIEVLKGLDEKLFAPVYTASVSSLYFPLKDFLRKLQ